MFKRYAKVESSVVMPSRLSSVKKLATVEECGFTFPAGYPRPGFLYTVVRAISARVNRNYDGFPASQLKASYRTFEGRPVFVNHSNHDPKRTRGVVLSSLWNEKGIDKYITLLNEVDAKNFPKLAQEIEEGGLDAVSMGTDVERSVCSYCENVATVPEELCSHVLHQKGKILKKAGEDCLVYEELYGLNFFEISYVFDPADETAIMQDVIKVASVDIKPLAAPREFILGGNPVHGPIKLAASKPPRLRPSSGEKQCANCKMFDGQGHCTSYDWDVRPSEVCDTWVARTTAKLASGQCANCGSHKTTPMGDSLICQDCGKSEQVYDKPPQGESDEDDGESFFTQQQRRGKLAFTVGEQVTVETKDGPIPGTVVADNALAGVTVQLQGGSTQTYPKDQVMTGTQNDQAPVTVSQPPGPTMAAKVGYGEQKAPKQVDTLRPAGPCPQCGTSEFDGNHCNLCDYTAPIPELDDPDVEMAQQMDLRQKEQESQTRVGPNINPAKLPEFNHNDGFTDPFQPTAGKDPSMPRSSKAQKNLAEARKRLSRDLPGGMQNWDTLLDNNTSERGDAANGTKNFDTILWPQPEKEAPSETSTQAKDEPEHQDVETVQSPPADDPNIESINVMNLPSSRASVKESIRFDDGTRVCDNCGENTDRLYVNPDQDGDPSMSLCDNCYTALEKFAGDKDSQDQLQRVKLYLDKTEGDQPPVKGAPAPAPHAGPAGAQVAASTSPSTSRNDRRNPQGSDMPNRQYRPLPRGIRRRADDNTKYDTADRVDVEKPVSGSDSAPARTEQYDRSKYDKNGPVADQPLGGDSKPLNSDMMPRSSSIDAMRLADAYVKHGLCTEEQKYVAAAEFEKLPSSIVTDRIGLLNKVGSVQGSGTRQARRSTVPSALAGRRVPSMARRPGLQSEGAVGPTSLDRFPDSATFL